MIKMQVCKIPFAYQFDEIVATNEPMVFVSSGIDGTDKFFSLIRFHNGKAKMYFLFGVKCDVLRCAEIIGNNIIINEKLYSCKTPLFVGDNYTWRYLNYENDVNFPLFGHIANEIHYFQRDDTLIVGKKKYYFPLKRLFTCLRIPRGILFVGESNVAGRNDFLISDKFFSLYSPQCRINDYLISRDEIITTRSIQFYLCLDQQVLGTRPIEIAGIPIMIYYTDKLHLILLCGSKVINVEYCLETLEFFSIC